LFLSFLLGALDDRPLLKRNASERVCKNRLHFFFATNSFFATASQYLAVCPLLLMLLLLPPYFKLTAVC
jgi:hypothetical protein